MMEAQSSPQEQLSRLFGSYKAEWLREQMFDLFSEPFYLPELETPRPCVLLGGRGTGKTTVLKCMSYEGQYTLAAKSGKTPRDLQYLGLYYRVNTNRVTAFRCAGISDARWTRIFAHYMNIELCGLIVKCLLWYRSKEPAAESLSSDDCLLVSKALSLEPVDTLTLLAQSIVSARIELENYVNNVLDGDGPALSLQGAPLDLLVERFSSLAEYKGRPIYFLIDEYENFLDYQQVVLNTLIKHCGAGYS